MTTQSIRKPGPPPAVQEAEMNTPVLTGDYSIGSVSDKISSLVLNQPLSRGWILGFGFFFTLLMVLFAALTYLLVTGIGVWGNNVPVGWAFDITNFVWWVGIGHAGTLISAILLLFRQKWRTSINRFAEAMTLFAVACAALFPAIHVGRPWFVYWFIPYPNTMAMWPQFRSPLVWDFFAISTYGSVSLLFWYVGLIPDLATLRDRAKNRALQYIYGLLAMGWRNSAKHWHRYETLYLILAGLATPLVVSVHTIVSFDFAAGIIPGWHSTIFPPYFVIGAIYSGFAMVLTIAIPLRRFYHLEDFITMNHIENMAKILLVTGSIVAYSYLLEVFMGWYSGNPYELFLVTNRAFGNYGYLYWALLFCNVIAPQTLWLRKVRTTIPILFVVALIVNVGMWLERFIIIAVSLTKDFLVSSWHNYTPTVTDFATYIGTIGLFFSLMFLFIRVLPVISIFEMRALVTEEAEHKG